MYKTVAECEEYRLEPPEYRPSEADVEDSEKAFNDAMEALDDSIIDLLGIHDCPSREYMTVSEDDLLELQNLIRKVRKNMCA